MKRSARILQMIKGRDENKENVYINKEISDTEFDFSDYGSNYTPSDHNNTSDDSNIDYNGAEDKRDLKAVTQFYEESSISKKKRLPSSPDDSIASSELNESDISHISSSPQSIVVTDSNLLKPINSLENEQNSIIVEHDVPNINENIIVTSRQKQKNTIYVRGKDFCFYCETLVLNFARHLFRNHINETDVQKILSKPKKSLIRKQLLTALRKKGNFIQNQTDVMKPMRKQKFTEYLPCISCLGFYSKKRLWKHKKNCGGNKKSNVQSEAQNLLVKNLKIDENLKETVFPRMRADKISLVAKSDLLICAYGSQYLKTHREKHFINVVSRKLRELAKLLIEIKKINNSITDLFSALKPINYDLIVEATKVVGNYDPKKDRFETPTFAMNVSTTLKQCCNIAIMFALKKQGPYNEINTAETEADLKTLIHLIDANWRYDISSQAATDLNKKKWNKITIVPLANDLKILKNYLNRKADEAATKIKEGPYTVATYIQLLETIYCKVLLLNRRRPGELQRIKLHDYLESESNESDKYEEFDRALSATERVLVKKFKRLVIRGKRGRGVPVLFNEEVQVHIKLLLSIRNTFLSTSNNFLFGNPGFENTIYGYKVLERYARLSGAKNPKSISSTRLRKHLATLSQIFSMTENDMEQLATFMGHTSDVHKKAYRLPDDVYQTAKISKLLILMENGKADAFKGKSLDEIDLDLNEELDEGELENDQILEYVGEPPDTTNFNRDPPDSLKNPSQHLPQIPPIMPTVSNFENNIKRGKKRTLVPWTVEQKKIVTNFFKLHIKNHQPPKKHECEKLKDTHPDLLSNKDWLKIKVFIQNSYSKK